MILGECGVFAAMLLSGMAAGMLALSLDVIGRAGKAARAIADILIAGVMGVAYFFALNRAAYGAFRLYSLAAYLLGAFLARALCRRVSPTLRRAARKVLSPLVSAYDKASKRWEEYLRPYREKRAAKLCLRRAKREEKKQARMALLEEKRARKRSSGGKKTVKERPDARIVVEH